MLELIIDYREKKLKDYFNDFTFDLNVNTKIENLDLGDIIIKKNNEIILIIERKTIADLYSSINDGRYREQKTRLLNNFSKSQILYLLEETDIKYQKKKFKNFEAVVNGSMINCIFRDKLNVIKTSGIDETTDLLKVLVKKVNKNIEFFTGGVVNPDKSSSTIEKSSSYIETIKIKKKDNITPKLCNTIMLTHIPGVSCKIASCIIDKYQSLHNLLIEYEKLGTDKDKETLLKNLKYSSNIDKNRNIGPVVSKRIYEFLLKID